MSTIMDLELEWYSNVRNGWTPSCDKCNENINRDNFTHNRNERGVYCEKCWNYIHIRKWECDTCKSTGSMRHEIILPKVCCEENVTWLK